jgi:hypothetical protein
VVRSQSTLQRQLRRQIKKKIRYTTTKKSLSCGYCDLIELAEINNLGLGEVGLLYLHSVSLGFEHLHVFNKFSLHLL